MKISVLVIAHNEEKRIARCIESLLDQTVKADEIIVVVHNSTDATEAMARRYPVIVIPFNGPVGITYARIEGLSHVSGDSILCIDGDSYAARNWVEEMTKTLSKSGNVLVGSWIRFKGTFFGWLSNFTNKYACIRGEKTERWVWGSSMGFWGRDREAVIDIFKQTFALSVKLGLTRNVDDYWLALFMKERGRLEVTNKTSVINIVKEISSVDAMRRNVENMSNGNKMEAYFASRSRV